MNKYDNPKHFELGRQYTGGICRNVYWRCEKLSNTEAMFVNVESGEHYIVPIHTSRIGDCVDLPDGTIYSIGWCSKQIERVTWAMQAAQDEINVSLVYEGVIELPKKKLDKMFDVLITSQLNYLSVV